MKKDCVERSSVKNLLILWLLAVCGLSGIAANVTAAPKSEFSQKEKTGGSFSIISVNMNQHYSSKYGLKGKEDNQRLWAISQKTPLFDLVLMQKNYGYKARLKADYEQYNSAYSEENCEQKPFFRTNNTGLSTLSHFELEPFLSYLWPYKIASVPGRRACKHDEHPIGGITGTTVKLRTFSGELYPVDVYNLQIGLKKLGKVEESIQILEKHLTMAIEKIKARSQEVQRPFIIWGFLRLADHI